MSSTTIKRALIAIWLLCGVALLMSPTPAHALVSRTVESSSPQEVVSAMANKLARGITNVATGWLEFPKQIYITYKEDGPVNGILIGPLRGIGMTLVRTGSGAGEAATFMVPFPGFYDPYFEPDYVWKKE